MGLFSRRSIEPSRRPHLADETHWWITGVSDFVRFFSTLPLVAPKRALIALGERCCSKEQRLLVDQRAVEPGFQVRALVSSEFARAPFLPLESNNLRFLIDWAANCAACEVALHVAVIADGSIVIEWFDAPTDPFSIAPCVSESAVKAFTSAAGGTYEKVESGV